MVLDEIKRKAEKEYFLKCAKIQASGGPNEVFMMPQQYAHAIKITKIGDTDAPDSKSESKPIEQASPTKLKRTYLSQCLCIYSFYNKFVSFCVWLWIYDSIYLYFVQVYLASKKNR